MVLVVFSTGMDVSSTYVQSLSATLMLEMHTHTHIESHALLGSASCWLEDPLGHSMPSGPP